MDRPQKGPFFLLGHLVIDLEEEEGRINGWRDTFYVIYTQARRLISA